MDIDKTTSRTEREYGFGADRKARCSQDSESIRWPHIKEMQGMLTSYELTVVAVAIAFSWGIKRLLRSTPDLNRYAAEDREAVVN